MRERIRMGDRRDIIVSVVKQEHRKVDGLRV
jgi:hypothetical protein